MFEKRPIHNKEEYWRVRNFLRELFLLNGRQEICWHVARLDYWRWHYIDNLHFCPSLDQVMSLWETAAGRLAAALHPFSMHEAFLAIHPDFRTPQLEAEMIAFAEERFAPPDD